MTAIVGLDGQPLRSASDYEGATRGARSHGWHAPSVGPNRALANAGKSLRNRTRAGYRNSLMMRSAINKNTTNEAGKGFTLLSTSKDDEFKASFNALWKISAQQLDPWGDLNFGGLIKLCVLSRRMSGEVFIRRLRRRLASGLELPLQVEIVESDYCPTELNRKLSARRRIIQGIEFDGKVKVAYWFYKAHPDDGIESVSLNQLERVPARDVIHHYMPIRPGQVRAEPEAAAALLKDRTFHEYDDAELVRKRQRSAFTGFLYREDQGEEGWDYDPATGKELYPGESQGYSESHTVNAGTILRGVPGEKLNLFNGDDTGQGYGDYVRWQAIMMSAGLDTPYPLMTGDWANLNDRLVRAMLNEYRRGIAFDQMNLSGFQVAFGIWRWAIETAISIDKIRAPGYAQTPWDYFALDIRPDAWKHLHPEQDINARNKAVSSNISNAEREAAEYGTDIEDNMRRNAKTLKRWEQILKEEGVKEPAKLGGLFSAQQTMGAIE